MLACWTPLSPRSQAYVPSGTALADAQTHVVGGAAWLQEASNAGGLSASPILIQSQLYRVFSSIAENCQEIKDVETVSSGKQALTDGKTSACLTEEAAKELTLDSFSSMAVLLHEDVPDTTSATLHIGLIPEQVEISTYLRNRDEDTTAKVVSCCVVNGVRVTAL